MDTHSRTLRLLALLMAILNTVAYMTPVARATVPESERAAVLVSQSNTRAAFSYQREQSAASRLGVSSPDPHDLIGNVATARRYTAGTDVWEVWVCDLPKGTAPVTPAGAASVLASELSPYYQWLSEGMYQPRFSPGGTAQPSPDDKYPCEREILSRSEGTANGAFVITDELNIPPAFTYPDTSDAGQDVTPGTFPDNGRVIRIGAHVVLPEAWNFEPSRAAHEIGHALGWGHSSLWDRDYDNHLDLMSGDLSREGNLKDRPQATLAINRYAAGWITPLQVKIHTGGTAEYRLQSIGNEGVQMLVLPSEQPGAYITLEVRLNAAYDTGLPASGVAIHRIEHNIHCNDPGTCPHPHIGAVRTEQGISYGLPHLLPAGAQTDIEGSQVEVTAGAGDTFTVRVTD